MTPELWILWAWLSLGGTQPTPMAAAFQTEQACEAAKKKIKDEASRVRYASSSSIFVCTPNYQVMQPPTINGLPGTPVTIDPRTGIPTMVK